MPRKQHHSERREAGPWCPCRRSLPAARHPAHPATAPRGPVAASHFSRHLSRGCQAVARRREERSGLRRRPHANHANPCKPVGWARSHEHAIAGSVAPPSYLRRRISRICRRIDTLSAGFGSPARHHHDQHRALPPSGRAIDTPRVADFKSEWPRLERLRTLRRLRTGRSMPAKKVLETGGRNAAQSSRFYFKLGCRARSTPRSYSRLPSSFRIELQRPLDELPRRRPRHATFLEQVAVCSASCSSVISASPSPAFPSS